MLPNLSALAVHDTDDTEGVATNKLIQKRGKAAERKAAKPIIELPAPGEESEPNSRLQLAPRSRQECRPAGRAQPSCRGDGGRHATGVA